MSQAAVERALGKLVTDESFRDQFFVDPAAASFNAGLTLSRAELDALARLSKGALAQFNRLLDDRICRLSVDGEERPVPSGGLDAGASGPPAESRTVIDTARRARKQGVG